MMYYPDGSQYNYDLKELAVRREDYERPENAASVLNIGWLETPHPFPTGSVSECFKDSLFRLCLQRINATRGYHGCCFCTNPPSTPVTFQKNGQTVVVAVPDPVRVSRNGQTIRLGTAEIRVTGQDGTMYAAPDMIYQYVVEHNYLPPAPFIRAVLEMASTQHAP